MFDLGTEHMHQGRFHKSNSWPNFLCNLMCRILAFCIFEVFLVCSVIVKWICMVTHEVTSGSYLRVLLYKQSCSHSACRHSQKMKSHIGRAHHYALSSWGAGVLTCPAHKPGDSHLGLSHTLPGSWLLPTVSSAYRLGDRTDTEWWGLRSPLVRCRSVGEEPVLWPSPEHISLNGSGSSAWASWTLSLLPRVLCIWASSLKRHLCPIQSLHSHCMFVFFGE